MSNGYVSHTGLNNRSFSTTILHRSAWLLIAGLFVASTSLSWAQTALPFSENFDGLAIADLNGQGDWVANAAVVQNTNVRTGKAASLTDNASTAVQVFDGAQTGDVWTDLYIKPVFGASDATVDTPP
ncbi:MAG: hypothetical protein OSB41_12100, partial [Kiritimatiellae bacterium]|nr:hypothetical protein [Kiritimatiellia bacterium]